MWLRLQTSHRILGIFEDQPHLVRIFGVGEGEVAGKDTPIGEGTVRKGIESRTTHESSAQKNILDRALGLGNPKGEDSPML